MRLLLVFIGGGAGSALRYLIGLGLNHSDYLAPKGTFLVNVLGSLLIGLLAGYNLRTMHINHEFQALLIAGFLGGFTTFSSFAFENTVMLQNGKIMLFAMYLSATIVAGLLAAAIGYQLSRFI
jgi:CrcB protein